MSFRRARARARLWAPARRHAQALVAACVCVSLAGCGAKGPPLPPLPKTPDPVRALAARQSGSVIELHWIQPAHRTDGRPLDSPLVYEVLARPADRTGSTMSPLTSAGAEGFLRSATIVAVVREDPNAGRTVKGGHDGVPPPILKNEAAPAQPGKPQDYLITLTPDRFPGTRLGAVRLAFAVIVLDARGRESQPGHIVAVDPVDALPALAQFSAAATPTGVQLSWKLPEQPAAAGSTGVTNAAEAADAAGKAAAVGSAGAETGATAGANPAGKAGATGRAGVAGALGTASPAGGMGPVGVDLFRRPGAAGEGARSWGPPLQGSPFPGETWLDTTAKIGEAYIYEARLASKSPGLGVREGPPMTAQIDYQDRFAPGAPALVTADAVLAPGPPEAWTVQVHWSSPIDTDVAGYRIYRAQGAGESSLVGQALGADIGWVDAQVAPGASYRYAVSAIDGANPPNESPRSEVAEATVPTPAGGGAKP